MEISLIFDLSKHKKTNQCVSGKNTRRYLNNEINRQGGPRPIQGEIGTVDDEDAHQLWWCCTSKRREAAEKKLPKKRKWPRPEY